MTAVARENVSFFYSGFESGNRVFYSCDYVESRTEMFLELFGAQETEVYCSGGIRPFGPPLPINVKASFNLPELSGDEVSQTVKIKSDSWNPNCGINVRIVQSLLPSFSNVEVLESQDGCPFIDSRYFYTFSILK